MQRFCSDGPVDFTGPSEQNMAAYQASIYMTYNGLLKIIFASRSGTADRFQDWATNIIYTDVFCSPFLFVGDDFDKALVCEE